jgi:hypothetical protein
VVKCATEEAALAVGRAVEIDDPARLDVTSQESADGLSRWKWLVSP